MTNTNSLLQVVALVEEGEEGDRISVVVDFSPKEGLVDLNSEDRTPLLTSSQHSVSIFHSLLLFVSSHFYHFMTSMVQLSNFFFFHFLR